MRFNLSSFASAKFVADRRGIAATEFALIAPALIFLVMGVLEMSFRFRAADDATRYVHQVADLVSREISLTEGSLDDIYDASVHMMQQVDDPDNLNLDVASIGFEGNDATPRVFWRRVAGAAVDFDLAEADGMGVEDESVIRVGVRYTYESVLSDLFGGPIMTIERSAYARPREERFVSMDGQTDDGGGTQFFGAD